MENCKNSLAVLILGAGSSVRLGEPKQLLEFKSQTLIKRAVNTALCLTPNVYVVLGHESEKIQEEIKDLPVTILINKNYKEGMGTTLAFGISKIEDFQRVLIMLTDQPLIPKSHFEDLLAFPIDKIVASKYNSKLAVPAVFPKKNFQDLKNLKGDKGARDLLRKEGTSFVLLRDEFALDIDNQEEYLKIKNY